MEVLVFYSSCKKKKKWYLVLLFCTAHTVTFSEMVCSNWSQPECLNFRIRSCWNVVRVVLSRPISSRTSFFSPRLKGVGCYLIGFLVPCILVRTLFSSGLLALPAIGNVHLKQKKKNVAPPYLSSVGAWVSTAVFSIRAICHTARKRRWWETKQTAVWVENWSWYWNCIIQASSRLGRGGWSGGLGNAMPAWTGGKTRAWRSLSSLSSPAHVWIFMVSGKQVHGCLLHCAEGSRAACHYCCSPLKWT